MPRVKVLNYLKKVALFFRFERDILAKLCLLFGTHKEKVEKLQKGVLRDF